MAVEIVSVRRYRDHGKALTLIVRIGDSQFADVDAVIEGADLRTIQRFFGARQTKLDLAPGRGLTVRGDWHVADDGGRLMLRVRHVGANITDAGPTSRWRAAQRDAVTGSSHVVRTQPRRKVDVQVMFSDVRDRLEDRNIVVIGHRRSEGGNDLFRRVQSDIRQKLDYSNQAVQGQPDVVGRLIAERLDDVSEHDTALIVIARGGGGAANRLPFDSAAVGNAIASCEERGIPVVTALGHTRDTHLADLVAWCSCTTPTDAATLLNSIWHADPVTPAPAYDPAESLSDSAPFGTTTSPHTQHSAIETPPVAGYPPISPTAAPPGSGAPRKNHGCLQIAAVLAALLVLLVLLVHFFSSSNGTSTGSPSSPAATRSTKAFASPSKNILCSAKSSTIRCDLDTVYYRPNSVPKQCRPTPNWGHVFVLDAKGGRMTCPQTRHTSAGRRALVILAYGHTMKIGGSTCKSTANYMECTHGRHGFRISKEAHKVW